MREKKTEMLHLRLSRSHLMKGCNKKPNESAGKAKTAFCTFTCEGQLSEWYIDSGASNRMTPCANLLSEMGPTNVNQIISASNTKTHVKSAGKALLKLNENEIEVTDVLYVPALAANLLSVCRAVNKGNSVLFDGNGCTIKNAVDTALTWHRRLSHMNYQSLMKICNGAVDGVKFSDGEAEIRNCEICAEDKQNRQFNASKSRSTDILQLIHSDTMGPMETISIGHATYILTFIDDFSKKVFVNFLKAKSEVLITFIDFKVFVENQMDKKIKIFRTGMAKNIARWNSTSFLGKAESSIN